jgi:hypothetical protein
VLLHLFRAVQAQSVLRFALNAFVYKVHGFATPALGKISLLDLDLLRKNVVADFFAVLPDEGTLAEHTFVGDDSHCEVVHRYAVVLAAHHFGGHVAGRSRGVLGVFGV